MSEQPPNAGRGAASARSSDLLVIHAAADEWFVHGALLPAVVEPGHVVELSSRLPLGGVALAELARAIAASRVTVVVVSSAFLSDRLSSLASLWASHAAVREGPLVVPVLIEDVAAPLYLEARVMLDLRDRGRWQEGLRRLRGEVVGGEPRRGIDEDPQGDELACPYPGMRAFAASDVSDYFGREQEADELAARLRAGERELYVVGPSGSGKSSLVAAGLLPRIGKRRAGQQPPLVRTFRPGARPVHRLVTSLLSEPGAVADAEAAILAGDGSWAAHALASALHQAADGASLLLFVDQLEELFALASAEEQARCIAALRHLREAPQVILVCTLRADFFGHLLQSELWRPGRTLHVPVAPLRREGLRASIVRPAERAGAWLEPGLVERLLADADEEPGTLPLLQETLVQLWDRRRHRVLTLADYQAMGDGERHGQAVVIARRADACLRALAPDEERVARRILLRLVSFGEGVADTRRQQSKAALGRGEVPERFEAALEALARQRVLRIDRTERNGDGGEVLVDLAHEALLSAWPTLASLVRDRRKDEAQRRLLAAKVAEWEERRVSDASAGLLDTVELKEAEGYLARAPDPELGEVLGLAELVQHSRAEREAVVRQRDDARRLLAAQYQEAGRQYLLEGRAQRSIPFLVAARELAVNNAALGTLFHRATLVQETSTFWQRDPIKMMVLGADEELLIAVSKQRAEFWHLPSRRQVAVVSHQARITSTEVSRDGRLVVTTSEDRTACIWDARTGARLLAPLQHPDLVLAAAFDRSGEQLVTACWDGAVRIWDVVTGAPRQLPLWRSRPSVRVRGGHN